MTSHDSKHAITILVLILFLSLLQLGLAQAKPTRTGDVSYEPTVLSQDCALIEAAVVALPGTVIKMAGNATISGHVLLTSKGQLEMNGHTTIEGRLRAAADTTLRRAGGHATIRAGIVTLDLDPSQAAYDLANDSVRLSPTLRLEGLKGGRIFEGNGGVNVIEIANDIELSGKSALLLSGTANDVFVFNVHGTMRFSGHAAVLLTGGLKPQNVLFNVIDFGDAIRVEGNARVLGTILGVEREFQVSGNGRVQGSLIGKGRIHLSGNGIQLSEAPFCSKAPVVFPSQPPSPTPTPIIVAPNPDPSAPSPSPSPSSTPLPPPADDLE